MTGWIQSADFESRDLGELDLNEAIAVFMKHDWASELAREKQLVEQGEETCPPGFGVVRPSGKILHLCPSDTGRLMAHYHFPARSGLAKWLGHQHSDMLEDTEFENAKRLIGHFYLSDHDDLVGEIRRLRRMAGET